MLLNARFSKIFGPLSAALIVVALTAGKCPVGESTTVSNCSIYDNEEIDCNLAKQQNGDKCIYSDHKCVVVPKGSVTGRCPDLTDKDLCEKRIDCKVSASGSCEDASSDCGNVKDETTCKTTYGALCAWNTTTTKCEKSSAGAQTVYTWKKVTLPAGTPAELTDFVVSGDNKHAYAFTNAGGGPQGLYHSADKGATWKRFESAPGANDGVISGMAKPGSAPAPYDAFNDGAPFDLKPTEKGAVLIDNNRQGVWLLEGAAVKWCIANLVNDATTAAGTPANLIANFINVGIEFVDVVDVNGVETVVFGQTDDVNTQYNVWLKRTDTNLEPLRVTIVKSGAGGPLTDNQVWMRAGNTHDGHLLLASVVGAGTNPGTGVWIVPAANLPANAAGAALPADIGKVAGDDHIFFPEDDQAWRGNVGSANVDIKVIGTFDIAGNYNIFAGLQQQGAGQQIGGFVYANGGQGVGTHASINLFGFPKISVLGINKFGGKTRVVTDKGLLGIAANGTEAPANNFVISAFAVSSHNMMATTKAAVPFTPAHDKLLVNIFGDDDLSWYWVDKTGGDAEAGLYLREKGQGQPRP